LLGTVLKSTVPSYNCGAISMPSWPLCVSRRDQSSLPDAGSSANAAEVVAP
jgi:hypothetical protein